MTNGKGRPSIYCKRWELQLTRSEASVRPATCPTFILDPRWKATFVFDEALGHLVEHLTEGRARSKGSPRPTCIQCWNGAPIPAWLRKELDSRAHQ